MRKIQFLGEIELTHRYAFLSPHVGISSLKSMVKKAKETKVEATEKSTKRKLVDNEKTATSSEPTPHDNKKNSNNVEENKTPSPVSRFIIMPSQAHDFLGELISTMSLASIEADKNNYNNDSDRYKKDFDDRNQSLRIVTVKNTILFPNNIMPLTSEKDIGDDWKLDQVKPGAIVGVIAHRSSHKDKNLEEQLYTVGTEAKVLKVIRFPDGSSGAVVQGLRRFKVLAFTQNSDTKEIHASVQYYFDLPSKESEVQISALAKAVKQLVHKAVSLSQTIPQEAAYLLDNVKDAEHLADFILPYLSLEVAEKQEVLEIKEVFLRLKKIHYYLSREVEILEISQKINSDVKAEISKHQRKFLVKEQLRHLQKELNEIEGRSPSASSMPQSDTQTLLDRVNESLMSAEAKDAAFREIERMNVMQQGSPEYAVSHTYINWLIDLPWGQYSQSAIHLPTAQKILDDEHYGLEKIKKRILEYLAVFSLKNSSKGPILLFVGPPGVGKTSLGKSIAKALNRSFSRISLGGVRDEAEVRGHRRTYVGSMPGKIVDAIKKSKSMDPVILLDEIDKISSDHRGDPSSALLEVLDPEQNHNFVDHYLNVPLDLSKVFFIATANQLSTIPAPLRDRMEIIELSSYTLNEKVHIASKHLLPQVLEENGLKDRAELLLNDKALSHLIHSYTRESGVRQLKRELAAIGRSLARELVEKSTQGKITSSVKFKVNEKKISDVLGPEYFLDRKKDKKLPYGVSTGLAWTPTGGDVLLVETVSTEKGTGKIHITGQLGDVMKESVQTVLAYIKANHHLFHVDLKSLLESDFHIHFPAAAVKKDGPSAGTAILLALLSLLRKESLTPNIAMTGEVSLRGDILPVGGIKEKVLAAHRYGIKTVLIPSDNEKDLVDVPQEVKDEITVRLVAKADKIIPLVFQDAKKENGKV